jgi:hypothetical protein
MSNPRAGCADHHDRVRPANQPGQDDGVPARTRREAGRDALTGVLPDQAALFGVLSHIEGLGLELLEVRRTCY